MKRLLQSTAITCLVVALSANVIVGSSQGSGVQSPTAEVNVYLPLVTVPAEDSGWYMAGANP